MADVFVVTVGEFSDYKILSVCSSEKEADRLIEAIGLIGEATIEKWTLDADRDVVQGMKEYTTIISLQGDVSRVYESGGPNGGPLTDVSPVALEGEWSNHLAVKCWARSAEHAIKIAGERRIRWIVENPRRFVESPRRNDEKSEAPR